jgi:hypothetical protein
VDRSFAWRWCRSFQNFNLAAIADVLGELGEIAHIKPLRADRAFFEMIGLVLSDAVAIVRADLTKKNPSRCRHTTNFCNT